MKARGNAARAGKKPPKNISFPNFPLKSWRERASAAAFTSLPASLAPMMLCSAASILNSVRQRRYASATLAVFPINWYWGGKKPLTLKPLASTSPPLLNANRLFPGRLRWFLQEGFGSLRLRGNGASPQTSRSGRERRQPGPTTDLRVPADDVSTGDIDAAGIDDPIRSG